MHLVTYALPYANGSLHLGHMMGFVATDIWVRAQRALGRPCFFICGSDAHGTPIMLSAQKQGISPEALIEAMQKEHLCDLKTFDIALDHFHTTHSDENRRLLHMVFDRIEQKGFWIKKNISQAYDPEAQMFLPDRMIRGTCPKCEAPDQYGDGCEVCGAHYTPLDLRAPRSVLSGATPTLRDSTHLFFDLPRCHDFLENFLSTSTVDPSTREKLKEWLEDGLRPWDVTRDAPYFGFEIPSEPGKYFYVWLDAPLGYFASLQNYLTEHPEVAAQAGLNTDPSVLFDRTANLEITHFTGKDIIYFHALFWPAVLHVAGLKTPTRLFHHGFLSLNGEKMSKSRGTFVLASEAAHALSPDLIRYYLASKMSPGIDDIDFNFEECVSKINADLVGKLVNIPSRVCGFLHTHFEGLLSTHLPDPSSYRSAVETLEQCMKDYVQRDSASCIRRLMALCDRTNQYIDQQKPWQKIKDEDSRASVQDICTQALSLFRLVVIGLAPIVPDFARRVAQTLHFPLEYASRHEPLLACRVPVYQPLFSRIQLQDVQNMIPKTDEAPPSSPSNASEPENTTIGIDDFARVDLRVAQVLTAEAVEGSSKLLKLQLDAGPLGTRQVFAGIQSSYAPSDLVGRLVVMVANLAPRTMRFGVSEGMVLVAKDEQHPVLYLLSPESGAMPGMKIS